MEPTVTCDARLENLAALLHHVDQTCRRFEVDPDTTAALRLAAEEVVVNIITHGYAGRPAGPIALTCGTDADTVWIVITDQAPPFDPTRLPPPNLDAAFDDRPIGGLGWHLVRETMDDVRYCVTPQGGNRVTLIKRRPPAPGSPLPGR